MLYGYDFYNECYTNKSIYFNFNFNCLNLLICAYVHNIVKPVLTGSMSVGLICTLIIVQLYNFIHVAPPDDDLESKHVVDLTIHLILICSVPK
jgi:hypothetical protein